MKLWKPSPVQHRVIERIAAGGWVGKGSVHAGTLAALERRGVVTIREGSRVVLTERGERIAERLGPAEAKRKAETLSPEHKRLYGTIGNRIRAVRLGYRQVPDRPFFLRIRTDKVPDGFNAFDLAPLGDVPSERSKYHHCWWEGEDGGAELLEASGVLRVREVRRPFTAIVGDDGELISTISAKERIG